MQCHALPYPLSSRWSGWEARPFTVGGKASQLCQCNGIQRHAMPRPTLPIVFALVGLGSPTSYSKLPSFANAMAFNAMQCHALPYPSSSLWSGWEARPPNVGGKASQLCQCDSIQRHAIPVFALSGWNLHHYRHILLSGYLLSQRRERKNAAEGWLCCAVG